MRFTNHSRLSFYGSLNNVNEFRRPGENTDWTPEMVGDGLTTVRFGGIDYFINDRQKRFKLEGSAVVRHNDDTYNNRTSSVNFLSGGDTYGLSASRSRYHSFSFFTSHDWLFNGRTCVCAFSPTPTMNVRNAMPSVALPYAMYSPRRSLLKEHSTAFSVPTSTPPCWAIRFTVRIVKDLRRGVPLMWAFRP